MTWSMDKLVPCVAFDVRWIMNNGGMNEDSFLLAGNCFLMSRKQRCGLNRLFSFSSF